MKAHSNVFEQRYLDIHEEILPYSDDWLNIKQNRNGEQSQKIARKVQL